MKKINEKTVVQKDYVLMKDNKKEEVKELEEQEKVEELEQKEEEK